MAWQTMSQDQNRESLKNLKPEDVQRLEVLSKIGKRINTPERFSEALQAVLDSVVESMEADRGALFLADKNVGPPTLRLWVDNLATDDQDGFRFSSTVVDKVWCEEKPLAEVDTQQNEDFASVASIQAEGIRSVICVPLIGRESKLGVLYLDNRLSRAFTVADLQMLDVIADLASTALERARFFEDLQSLNNELELRVVQRTAEAEQARDEAERATKAKSMFLAKMSHELRTPLNGVLGLTEDLAQREANPALRLQLGQIIESARSLSTLVNGVLDFSKLESENAEMDSHPFLVEDVVAAALATVNYQAHEKGLELQVWVDGSVPIEVEGDSTRLQQILINLLGNAVKFTPQGHVRLLVTTVDDQHVMFTVSDSGIGIPQDKQKAIFTPFAQADTSTTRQFGGTGLGLSISRSLCQLMGGELVLESEAGSGSKFSFTLPLRTRRGFQKPDFKNKKVHLSIASIPQRKALEKTLTDWGCEVLGEIESCDFVICLGDRPPGDEPCLILLEPGEARPEVRENSKEEYLLTPILRSRLNRALDELLGEKVVCELAEEPLPCPPEGSTILVAEDHEINRLVVGRMLEKWGYRCEFAASGSEALELFQKHKPRLVLMDIEMPGQDGFSTARELRGLEGNSPTPVPVIAVTAHLAADLRERCLASGMDDLLIKPLTRSLLAKRLIRWESVLENQLSRETARHDDFEELSDWQQGTSLALESRLTALADGLEAEALEEAVRALESDLFRAGLCGWGGRLVKLARPLDSHQVKALLTDFRQEWRAAAPSLVQGS